MKKLWTNCTDRLENMPAPDFQTFVRVWIAKVFYDSGRTKVDEGYLDVSDVTIMLFEEEYDVPLLSPELAAHLALYAETFLPILLILGLATRLSALALLGMTIVIQIFVYPMSWTDHLLWAVALAILVMRGAGRFSLDALVSGKK